MSLIDRAKEAFSKQNQEVNERREAEERREKNRIVLGIRSWLEIEISPDDLTELPTPNHRESLWFFEHEGLKFITGYYWHGNPGESFYLAIRNKKRAKGNPEWPPPHPKSVGNTRWAPQGYTYVAGLASLGKALEDLAEH